MTEAEDWTKGLHRSLRVRVGEGETRAILHDDFHHFRLQLRHGGAVVQSIRAEMLRGPYSLCPRAGERLEELVGRPLADGATGLSLRMQCTHQFELALLAMAATVRGQDCAYAIGVAVEGPEQLTGWVERDGVRLLGCAVEDEHFTAPSDLAGQHLGVGFTAWAADRLSPDLGEAVLLLRRCLMLGRARRHIPRMDELGHAPVNGHCWVQRSETAEAAKRNYGVVRDYSHGHVPFDSADQSWLADTAT